LSNFELRLQLRFGHPRSLAKPPATPPVLTVPFGANSLRATVDLSQGTLTLNYSGEPPGGRELMEELMLDRELQRLFMKRGEPGPRDFEHAKEVWERYTDAAKESTGRFTVLSRALLRLLGETILRLRLPPNPVDSEPLISWRIGDGAWRDIPPSFADKPRKQLGDISRPYERYPEANEPLSKLELDFIQSLLDSGNRSFAPLHHLLQAVSEPLPHVRVVLAGMATELALKDALHRRTGIKQTGGNKEIWEKRYPTVLGQRYAELDEFLALTRLRNGIVHDGIQERWTPSFGQFSGRFKVESGFMGQAAWGCEEAGRSPSL